VVPSQWNSVLSAKCASREGRLPSEHGSPSVRTITFPLVHWERAPCWKYGSEESPGVRIRSVPP